jgi:hypothetical protein
MRLEMLHNGDQIASIDLRPTDTFTITTDARPVVAGVEDRTVLTWGRASAWGLGGVTIARTS